MTLKSLILVFFIVMFFTTCSKDEPGLRQGRTSALFSPDHTYGTMTDIEGNEYRTIEIGTQTWMAENLRVKHYRNAEPIPNVTGDDDPYLWSNLDYGAWCSYENTTDVDSIATYGLLYNWYAVDDERGLCPMAWRVPTDEDWSILVEYVDAGDGATNDDGTTNSVVGGRMKETGTLHWDYPNRFATNSSGFTAIPGGHRFSSWDVEFSSKGNNSYMWSSSLWEEIVPLYRNINTNFATIGKHAGPPSNGLSVRCIKE
ncbi:MAG: fibrobacter succinogenes major paralogous domain-containing protein [Bacteroidales bacterium]